MPLLDLAIIFSAACASAVLALLWVSFSRMPVTRKAVVQESAVSFLFEKEDLHHASDAAVRLHDIAVGEDTWQTLREKLKGRFPALPDLPLPPSGGPVTIRARNIADVAQLRLAPNGSFTQVFVDESEQRAVIDNAEISGMMTELESLRRASDTTPHPVWQVNPQGHVVWHNAAYGSLYDKLHGGSPKPDRPVFSDLEDQLWTTTLKRVSARPEGSEKKDWYDVRLIKSGDIRIFHAIDVNAVVDSEIAQRNFVQTLAKTFAQLSIGLAIFDRRGQLALFNPALIDLTHLPADFLSARPTLMSFFDRLRENRRMPEPKNYHSWRQEISEVIAAATDGRYQETWTLETGQTYRVRGRPHPDGAIAFLIEDISAEISLTRNFRAELEMGQSLMDTFDEALVVFSSNGVLSFCNAAYRKMWGLDPDNSFADVTIADSIREWKRASAPGARWAALTDFVMDYGERTAWDLPIKLLTGQLLHCHVAPIASGATVLRFTAPAPARTRTARNVDPSDAR